MDFETIEIYCNVGCSHRNVNLMIDGPAYISGGQWALKNFLPLSLLYLKEQREDVEARPQGFTN
jgi:hypothetical protein